MNNFLEIYFKHIILVLNLLPFLGLILLILKIAIEPLVDIYSAFYFYKLKKEKNGN